MPYKDSDDEKLCIYYEIGICDLRKVYLKAKSMNIKWYG